MIYLSQLLLNPQSQAVRHDVSNCHQLHRTILAAFPQAPGTGGARAQFGVLYRLEADDRGPGLRLLVQSRAEPDWSRLPATYLYDTGGQTKNPGCKRIDEHYARLTTGMVLLFRLRANPTRRVNGRNEREGKRWQGRRVELRDEAAQLAWLRSKGERHGFELLAVRANADVPDVRTTSGTTVVGRRSAGVAEEARLTFGSVLFEGRLLVTDAEQFQAALADGIGSGKAYGFGLLSVMPGGERAE